MKLTDIKNLTNARLAGEQLTYSALVPYFDAVIDEINSKLHSCFKTFSEVNSTGLGNVTEYTEFPDKYIRTVVCVGAAAMWYTDDEEGIETATALHQQYINNLFIMMRDYGPLVPEDKKRKDKGGFLAEQNSSYNNKINPDLRYIEVKGIPGTSVTDAKVDWVGNQQHLKLKFVDPQTGVQWVDCGVINTGAPIVRINQDLPIDATLPKYTVGIKIEDI
jgi:hypothetical protein